MASRNLLHINKLPSLKDWLVNNGFEIQPTKGYYEVLRAKKGKDTIVIYRKLDAKEHYTVQDKDWHLIRRFMNSFKKRKEKHDNE